MLVLLGIAHDNGRRFPFPGYKSPVRDLYTAILRYRLNRAGSTAAMASAATRLGEQSSRREYCIGL